MKISLGRPVALGAAMAAALFMTGCYGRGYDYHSGGGYSGHGHGGHYGHGGGHGSHGNQGGHGGHGGNSGHKGGSHGHAAKPASSHGPRKPVALHS